MNRSATLFLQLLLLAIAILCADFIGKEISFIPKFIISLPDVDYSPAEFWAFVKYFSVVHVIVFLISQYACGRWIFSSGRSTADTLYAVAAGFSLSTLLIFVTSSASFDANLMVGILLIHIVLVFVVFLFSCWRSTARIGSGTTELLGSVFSRLITIPGILIVLLTASPGIMAKLFVSDRDFANVITQARIYFSPSESLDYTFYNPLFGAVFQQPVLVRDRPDEPGYLYVLERGGILSKTKLTEEAPREVLLDITDTAGYVEVENGVLGFAFHPSFGRMGTKYVYIYYTSVLDGTQTNFLSRFDIALDSVESRGNSEQIILSLSRETSGFHNGGGLEFGPDGYLYLALGEGVHPKGVWALSETLRGGVLRIDVDCGKSSHALPSTYNTNTVKSQHYCIPDSNPFIGSEEVRDEYWALGLRNPFRVSFDTDTGLLWAGDVGSTKWEEVNVIREAGHYEFPFREGYEQTSEEESIPELAELVPPLYAYIHTAFDRAVIGGAVYRGDKFPELIGQYIFGDNYSSKIFMMPATGEQVETVTHLATANQYAQRGLSSLSLLSTGDIVATTLGRNTVASGEVLFLVPEGSKPEFKATETVVEEYSEEEIRQIYVANCSRCHGKGGQGDGPDSAMLGVEIADFSNSIYQNKVDDVFLRSIISVGGYDMDMSPLMPSWSHVLSDGEIQGLVNYIRALESND